MSENQKTPYLNNVGNGDKYNFKKRKQKVYLNIVDGAGFDGTIKTDPLGMYTGVPENPYEQPIQDADDL